MGLIYVPKGKAGEYSPLALNVYTEGCDHGCTYCYCNRIYRGKWGLVPQPRTLRNLKQQAAKSSKQILLSFIGDPYCKANMAFATTRFALYDLLEERCSVAILTKGGTRCLIDLELFKDWPGGRLKVGATLTGTTDDTYKDWEPGAAEPSNRIRALKTLHDAGIQTWVSMEPIVFPTMAYQQIRDTQEFVNQYMLGAFVGEQTQQVMCWYADNAIRFLRKHGKPFYVKEALRPYCEHIELTEQETTPSAHWLLERK